MEIKELRKCYSIELMIIYIVIKYIKFNIKKIKKYESIVQGKNEEKSHHRENLYELFSQILCPIMYLVFWDQI